MASALLEAHEPHVAENDRTETAHREARPSAAPAAPWVAIAAGITGVAVLRKGGFYWPDYVVLPGLLVALAVLAHPRLDRRARITVGAVMAFVAWWLVAGFGWGIPHRALLLAGSVAGFGAAFVLGRAAAPFRQTVRRGIVALGAASAAVGLVGVAFRIWPLVIQHEHMWRLSGTVTYANAVGILLVACAPLAVSDGSGAGRAARAALFLMICAAVATMSRGAGVALVAAALFMPGSARRAAAVPVVVGLLAGAVCVATATGQGFQPLVVVAVLAGLGASVVVPRRRGVVVPVVGAALVAGAVVALVGGGLFDAASRRLGSDGFGDRGHSWAAAARQIDKTPVVGNGAERDLFLAGHPVRRSSFAHNEYLQVTASAGVVGAVLLVLLLWSVGRLAIPGDMTSSVARAGLVALAVGGLFDFAWHIPAVGIVAGWIAALQQGGDQ